MYEAELFIDIASEVYQLRAGDKFTLTLASTLDLEGKPDSDYYEPDGKVKFNALGPSFLNSSLSIHV